MYVGIKWYVHVFARG